MKRHLTRHSLVINGRRTSVTLEDAFWKELTVLASTQQLTVSTLASRIALAHDERNLPAALRVYVLNYYRTELQRALTFTLSPAPGVGSEQTSLRVLGLKRL
jgi:predicted DNA-binding ribbon-helix-helix protein